MDLIFSYDIIITLITLTFLEIILGIDNIIFIALVAGQIPEKVRTKARYLGISLALIIRIAMLFMLSWIMSLTKPIFSLGNLEFSIKSLLLIIGGLFLVFKSAAEIYSDIAKTENKQTKTIAKSSFFAAAMQITLVDFVFSFDSIITAIAITDNITIIIIAVLISMIVMLAFSGKVSEILINYPNLKTIALAFIFAVGVILILDGFSLHIAKGYLYCALFFTFGVEFLNILRQKNNCTQPKK
ncbi:TerC family protein [Flavobacteriaceae bacterium]|nr:TerC family protein [Flavobacteriaceae bacterium]